MLRYDVDLRGVRLVDAARLARDDAGRILVAATGARALGVFDPASGALYRVSVGLAPGAPVLLGDGRVLIPGRLDDTLTLVDTDEREGPLPGATIRLGPPERSPSLETLGEILFSDRVLWEDSVANDFTCQSCHWGGGSDHRVHPGYLERRWERTRTTAGAGMVAPVFTPMQAPTLARAVEGFFEVLDRRHWTRGRAPREPVSVALQGRTITLSPRRARRALLRYLVARTVERGAWRQPDGRFSPDARRGAVRFLEHCGDCHAPVANLRRRRRVAGQALLETLRARPLAFGAPVYVDAGIAARFTPDGHRVSPLLELSRGGPYFSDGSAASLAAVLERTDPSAALIHAPGQRDAPALSAAARADLRAFLLAL